MTTLSFGVGGLLVALLLLYAVLKTSIIHFDKPCGSTLRETFGVFFKNAFFFVKKGMVANRMDRQDTALYSSIDESIVLMLSLSIGGCL